MNYNYICYIESASVGDVRKAAHSTNVITLFMKIHKLLNVAHLTAQGGYTTHLQYVCVFPPVLASPIRESKKRVFPALLRAQ